MNKRPDQNAAFARSAARPRCRAWLSACLALGAVTFVTGAKSDDLVSHNGFEPCWSSALTADSFLQLLVASTSGRDVCIAPAQDGSLCANSLCSDGSPGCSVTLRSGQHTPIFISPGDPGSARFDGSTGFDPFSVPVVVPVVGACTLNIPDTADVLVVHQLNYALRPDGNSGYYLFNASALATMTGLSDNDASLSGSPACQLASLGLGFFLSTISDQLSEQIAAAILSRTSGQSLCPLP